VKEKPGELKCPGQHYCEDKMAVDSIEGALEREVEKYPANKALRQADSVEGAIAVLPKEGLQNNDPSRHDLACEAYSLAR
jgi:flavorubredoxin